MKRTISLQRILLISLTLVMIVAGVVQGLYLYSTAAKEIANNIRSVASDTVDAHKQTLNQYLQNLEGLAFSIQNSSVIQAALRISAQDAFAAQHYSNQEVMSFLEKLSYSYEDIVGIALVTHDRSVYNYASPFGFYNGDLLTNTEILSALAQNEKSGFVPTFQNDIIQNSSYKNIFCYYCKLYRNDKLAATICIFVSSDVFKKLSSNAAGHENYYFLYAEDKMIYPFANDEALELLNSKAFDEFKPVDYKSQAFLPMKATLTNGWTMVNLIPSDKLNQSTIIIIQRAFLGFLLAFILYFICIYIISRSVSHNLKKLNRKMSSVGIEPYVFKGTSHISEIAMLNGQFNDMSNRIDDLLIAVKNEQKEMDKVQLELLRAQINPHFLYNTLDAINWMAIEQNADDISAMTSNLAAMFRYGLNHGLETTMIGSEIIHIEKYIEIQKCRYDNRFSFNKTVDESLLTQSTLNIILQPFIENSLLHGFRNSQDTISIKFTLEKREALIVFRILDDGVGCNPDFMNDYLSASQITSKGYGVKNVHKRIKLHFGNDYGVHYLCSDIGTLVEITIPYKGETGNV